MLRAAAHRVVVERNLRGWKATVPDIEGLPGIQVAHLAAVEPRIRKLIWAFTNCDIEQIQLDIDVIL